MDVWIWVVLVGVAAVAVAVVWWKRRARSVYVIDHVRVEMHPACVVDDRVIEQVWRAAISMTNTSRRPRTLPVLAERATVRAGWRAYLASVYLDADVLEVNPGAVAVAWAECVLPRDSVPAGIRLNALHNWREPRGVRFTVPGSRRTLQSPRLDVPARTAQRPSAKPG